MMKKKKKSELKQARDTKMLTSLLRNSIKIVLCIVMREAKKLMIIILLLIFSKDIEYKKFNVVIWASC